MQNGSKTMNNTRQSRSVSSFKSRSVPSFNSRPRKPESNAGRQKPQNFQNAQRSYERYLALAQAEVLAGDIVGAENYYQHAEHYFRSMSPNAETA